MRQTIRSLLARKRKPLQSDSQPLLTQREHEMTVLGVQAKAAAARAESRDRIRFHIAEFYRNRDRHPIIAAWHIQELLQPSDVCPACGFYWFVGCTH